MDEKLMETLDCTDIKALLSGLIDDRVDPALRHRAERHLAECKPCRQLLNQAETAEAMVAASVSALGDSEALPEEFEAKVLARTVHAERLAAVQGRWVNWLGWMAAAAALALAVTVWVMDSPTIVRGPIPEFAIGGGLEDESVLGNERLAAQPANFITPDPSSFIELNRLSMTPSLTRTSIHSSSAALLSRDDLETLDDVSRLLMMLSQTPDQSLVEVQRIRRIAEYDLLLMRIAQLRANLAPQDRIIVSAAESVLYRVVRGPLSLEDVQIMRDDVNRLELPSHLDAIGNRLSPASSL